MYDVIVEKSVIKQLQKIPPAIYRRIKTILSELVYNPRPQGYLKLKGREGYRIRVGDYRIIDEINDKRLIVHVVTVGHRRDVYE